MLNENDFCRHCVYELSSLHCWNLVVQEVQVRWNKLGALKNILQLSELLRSRCIEERPALISGDTKSFFQFHEVARAGHWQDHGLLQPFTVISEWSCSRKTGSERCAENKCTMAGGAPVRHLYGLQSFEKDKINTQGGTGMSIRECQKNNKNVNEGNVGHYTTEDRFIDVIMNRQKKYKNEIEF